MAKLKSEDEKAKKKQKKDFDRHHRAMEVPPLTPGERVWIPDRESKAVVDCEVAPRSYEFTTSEGSTVRRNQSSVQKLPEYQLDQEQEAQSSVQELPKPDQEETMPRSQMPEVLEPGQPSQPTSFPLTSVPETAPLRRSARVPKLREFWEPRWN